MSGGDVSVINGKYHYLNPTQVAEFYKGIRRVDSKGKGDKANGGKTAVMLDDQELDLTIKALTDASEAERYRGKAFRSKQFQLIARKIIEETIRFQDKNVEILERKYGIKKEKPRFAEPTFRE